MKKPKTTTPVTFGLTPNDPLFGLQWHYKSNGAGPGKSGGGAGISGEESDIHGVRVTIADTTSDDRGEVAQIADRFREGKRSAVLVLFSTAGRGAIHVALTDDLVSAGRKAGDLVNRIAALSGGKGGGRPHFASAGAGDPGKLEAARAATLDVVSTWLNGAGA